MRKWKISVLIFVLFFITSCASLKTDKCNSTHADSAERLIYAPYILIDRSLLYFVDAHSQVDQLGNPLLSFELHDIPKTMAKYRVCGTLLSARGTRDWHDIVGLAKHHEGIFPSVRTKSKAYISDTYSNVIFEAVKHRVSKQLNALDYQGLPAFLAISETLIYHAAKYNRFGTLVAPRVSVPFNDNRAIYLEKRSKEKDWPFVIHIEFRALRRDQPVLYRGQHLDAFKNVLSDNRDIDFVLNHLGQLAPDEISGLILNHDNIYFLAAHVTPVTTHNQPWTIIFARQGQKCTFKDPWKILFERHPDRFIFALDNVFQKQWAKEYEPQMNCWLSALRTLPPEAAHSIAHRNAEDMWGLPR